MVKRLTLLLTVLLLLSLPYNSQQSDCQGWWGYVNCGQYNYWGTCYQNNAGSFVGCDTDNGYWPYNQYYLGGDNYNGWQQLTIYRKCDYWCTSCDGTSNPDYHCQSCRASYKKWGTSDTCYPVCPSVLLAKSRNSYGYGINTVGQYADSSSTCTSCHPACNYCSNSATTSCYSCTSGYNLIDPTSVCSSLFSANGYGPQYSCSQTQCMSGCPSYYYYQQSQGNINANFWSWAVGTSITVDGTAINYRLYNTNICYFCNYHCQQCSGPNQNQCNSCKRYNYMWAQYPNYCSQSCPRGGYLSTDWVGEYVDQNNVNLAAGTGDRTCHLCDSNCRWCRYSSSWCLQCKDGNFLVDLYSECRARFIDPGTCTVCALPAYNGCDLAGYNYNRNCKSSCPTYLFFPVYRTGYSSTDYRSVYFSQYSGYTSATQSYLNGNNNAARTTQAYRYGTNLCMLCNINCLQCYGPHSDQCYMCTNGFHKWLTHDICYQYCPTVAISQSRYTYGFGTNTLGQYIDTDTTCDYCDSACNFCTGGTFFDCYSCLGTNVLIDDAATCTTLFSAVGYGPQWNCFDHQCWANCPPRYYYFVPQATVNSTTPFSTWSTASSISNGFDNGAVQYRRLNNYGICYFCNYHCQTCTDQYQYSCPTCKRFNYRWNQYPNYCSQSCPRGVYAYGGSNWVGQYIDQTVTSIATGMGDRTCHLCDANCRWCRYTSSNCLQCKDGYFLLDLHTQCMARYIDAATSNCALCRTATYNMCQNPSYNIDRKCLSACPTYFYFPIYRIVYNNPNDERDINFQMYKNYTDTVTEQYVFGNNDAANTTEKYRFGTNLCMLCDFRCIKCTGPRNTQCSICTNGYYKWTNNTICEEYCPVGQYIARDLAYPANETQCANCYVNCLSCEIMTQNCSSCVGANYAFYNNGTNPNVAFLYTYNSSYAQCLNTCPIQPNATYGTRIGYYGSFVDLNCYPCPSPCSNCDLSLVLSQYPYINCGTDRLCMNALKCTSCLLGYALVAGKCIAENNCREYAYYVAPAVSTSWSAVDCQCLDGYSSSIFAACNIRCHISCKTCSGTSITQCLSCYTGYTWNTGTKACDLNTAKAYTSQTWTAGVANGNAIIAAGVQYNGCGSFYSMYGYEKVTPTTGKYLGYTFGIGGLSYYAISIKIGMIFVDQFTSRGAIYVSRDSASNAPIWAWNYDTKNAYGQQLCATNKMDYVLFATAVIPTINRTTQTFYITSNQNLQQSNLGYQLHWGISSVLFTVLKCDPLCSRCTGPSSSQCVTCANTGYIPVNGTCVCDTASNYYYWIDGLCHYGCPLNAGWYRDNIAKACVQPINSNCTPPYRFGQLITGNAYGDCVKDCGTGLYASMKTMTCLSNCWTGAPNQYKFDGAASRTCQDICPTGYIKDVSANRQCVVKCPATYYFQIQNAATDPTCTAMCPSGWQYDGLQLCVTTCPSGYFRQVISGHNKCVSTCTNAFADPSSNNCTTSCPFPTYADSLSKTCVDVCSNASQYMQVAVSNSNRTCVGQCQAGQWGNPFTKKCSNYTTDCPNGYYADSHVWLCVANCTTPGQLAQNSTKQCRTSCLTGFAHYASRACVQMCPTNPAMFGYIAGKLCVYSCNWTLTGLYGDAQANRTCVQKCSAAPTPTFGQNTSSLCVDKCTVSTQYADPNDIYRRCVTKCSNIIVQLYANPITKQCVVTCPDQYFGQIDTTLNSGVCIQTCYGANYGDPTTNWCRPICKWGYYGLGLANGTRICVQTCPRYWYGINGTTNRVCVQTCDSGYWADIQTSMCYNVKTSCTNNTYADPLKGYCVINTNCTVGTFADPFTRGCQSSCSNGYYADSNINTCVQMCEAQYDQYGQWGICRYNCIVGRFADFQANRTCVRNCSRTPLALYGVIAARRICVIAANCPTNFYGDNVTLNCVNPCTGTFPFGDPISKQCVIDCPDGYYGDYDLSLCVQRCNFATFHYADNATGNCETLCSPGTFGVNATVNDTIPSCQEQCPPGSYAWTTATQRICVLDCGAGLYGDPIKRVCYSSPFNCSDGYYANSVSHLCVLPANCQTVTTHFFAQNETKTCIVKCATPNYGDSMYWTCVPVCNQTSYGQNNTNLCVTDCTPWSSFAQNQNNLCVARCSNTPIKHYAEVVGHTCVQAKNCPVTSGLQTFAQNSSQTCIPYCGTNQWADSTTFRCVAVCPNGYYSDTYTGHNICTSSCPTLYRYRDNSTKSCVPICPLSNATFGDSAGDQCVYTCPSGTFAQVDANRRCVPICASGTWGNKQTRICITQPLLQCPNNTWADNSTWNCEQVCDTTSGYYGLNSTRMCVTSCPSPTFAWDGSRVCIDICPASLIDSGYFGDPLTTPTRKCFTTCQTALYYRDVAASRTCVPACTYNSTYKTYKDPTTWSCEAICSTYPQVRYADDNLKSCQLSCAGSLKKNDATRTCVSSCTNLYDPTTDKCVDICPTQSTLGALYANVSFGNNTCIVGSSCPTRTWADTDSRTCASSCPINTYKYGKFCVYVCPNDYFMDNGTQSCVTPTNCSPNLIADNQTRSCISQCIGTFYESTLNRCIDVCFGSKYGDPYTHSCQPSCSQGLRINVATHTCQSSCTIGLYSNPATGSCTSYCSSPYFADNVTMACVTSCSANPMTFASVSASGARECVGRCDVSKMHDMVNRACVSLTGCPANTYSYTVNMSCVSFCPSPSYYQLGTACVLNCSSDSTLKYADDVLRKCVAVCSSGTYKDNTTYKCVTACPTAPLQYYISPNQGRCVLMCPQGLYADPQLLSCVTNCSLSPPMFAQQVTNMCVQVCPLSQNQFADPTTGKCVTSCPSGYFTDSRDRTCKQNCSFLFSDTTTNPKSCVANCSLGLYADQLTFKCVSTCPTGYYKHITRQCVQFCPYGYYLNPLLSTCVVLANCPSTLPYADNLTHLCTANCSSGQFGFLATGATNGGKCQYYCPTNYYANPISGKCQTSCPTGFYAETDNNTCMANCTYDKFMDWVNKKCVPQCPASSSLFANLFNRTCVTQCDPATFTFADTLTRNCQKVCTGNQYADPDTQTCVGPAACSNGRFSDPYYKQCVNVCNNGTYGYLGKCIPDCPTATADVYGSYDGQLCVTALSCPNGTYADPVLHKCVQFCPISSSTFADDTTKRCLPTCNSPLFADNLTRTCVSSCPNISKMYGDTLLHKCVLFCTYPYFADETTNLCKTGCPNGYFADISTLTCVQVCPQGMFGNNITNYCVPTCPSGVPPYFGDPVTRMCILYCPNGTFADADNNRKCFPKCIGNINTFAQNTTNICQSTCSTGFANPRTKQCIGICTAGYYGYNKVCYTNCPTVSPTVFADNTTHLCQQTCPNNTFADYSTLKCVHICPISNGTFGDYQNWVCRSQCLSGYYADNSTRMCVPQCPSMPALYGKQPQKICLSKCTFGFYADNSTRMCKATCPNGTYADDSTMRCQLYCPLHPTAMYADNITNKCIPLCWADRDMYADNATGTCVYHCTTGTFADSTSRQCVDTCPYGYYAVIRTGRCELGCQPGTFADSLIRVCVTKCSLDPIFYGDPIAHQCVPQCPTGSYGNPLTQQCVFDVLSLSNCPLNYYGDATTQLCVLNCPMKRDLYADPNLKKCQSGCTGGKFADNSTMRCVDRCPTYPASFGNLNTMRCIPFCISGTYADPISRTCVSNCPNSSYADNSTWRCVINCPQNPLTFADNTTWSCVPLCPPTYYSDNSTLTCVQRCPTNQSTFAENTTQSCVRVCPNNTFGDSISGYCISRCYGGKYSDNFSRLCVSQCSRYPASYADPTTDQCVSRCPPTYFSFQDNRTCTQNCPASAKYKQQSTASCVSKCRYDQGTYGDNATASCTLNCSVNSWADPNIRVCVAVCPDQPLMYADNSTQTCVYRCPGVTYGENTTRSCVNSCPPGSLSLPQNNLCVRYCPIGYFAYNITAFCFDVCPGVYYGDPSTRSCVLTCSLSQLLYADNSSKQCVRTCPPGSYADKKSVSCASACPTPDPTLNQVQTYAADYNNVCVQQCSLPYFAYQPTKKCVTLCPNPYYNNLRDHTCKLCPSTCLSCTTYQLCTTCISGYLLQNGACVQNCSSLYYANYNTMKCVTSGVCRPNFGVNSTRQCSATCPAASFANPILYRCDACQPQCLTCTSWTYCTVCNTTISILYRNYCYMYCESINDTNANNITQPNYSYDNSTCLLNCPSGNYLSVIFCKNCSAICETCTGTADNCTRCSGGLYLKSTVGCVSSCGDQYKPNTLRNCIYCGTTCGNGLDFTTNMTQINGQNTIFVTFSDTVTLNGDPNQIFSLQQKTARLLIRRMLGIGYQIIVVDSKTIKIVMDSSMNSTVYTVNINQPENVQDAFGNLPAKVRDSVEVDLSNTYTTTLSTAPQGFSIYFAILAAVCVISFLFDIEFMKFLQILYIHYYVVMTLPPQLSKVLLALKWSTLNYLPNIYPVPAVVLRNTVTGKVYDAVGDLSFLRTAGFMFTPLAVILVFWIVLKILSVPEINTRKNVRMWCKQQLQQKFKFAIVIQWLSIVFMNSIFFIFMQMKDYNNYDAFSLASIVIAHITLVLFVITFVYLAYRVISFFREYPKLSQNLKKATDLILQQSQYHKLNSTNIFLFQLKKIDLRNLYYPKINNQNILPFRNIYRFSFLPLCSILVTYLRAIVLSIIIVFGSSTLLQMSLCIPLNVLCLLYVVKTRPFSFKWNKKRIRNYIAIYQEAALIGFELLMLVLGIMDRDLSPSADKEKFANGIIYYLCAVVTISFIYFAFRVAVQVYRRIWMPFTETEIFMLNFPQKYKQIHGDKKEKLLRGIDPKAKQTLRALIKGYKKNRSSLRPNLDDKQSSNMPMRYKITRLDRSDTSSVPESRSSMSKTQKRKMIQEIFQAYSGSVNMKQSRLAEEQLYEQVIAESENTETEFEYEQYEQQIEIKAKDLHKYVRNPQELLKIEQMNKIKVEQIEVSAQDHRKQNNRMKTEEPLKAARQFTTVQQIIQ